MPTRKSVEYNAFMDQQRRCLSGMAPPGVVGGVPIAVAAVAPATVLHTLDTSQANDANGRPYMDVVSLFISNGNAAADGAVTIAVGATTFDVLIPMGEIVQVFVETPFGGPLSAPNGGLTITAVAVGGGGASTDFVAWGWFVRTQG